jgi:hypothetical protein
LAKWPPAPRHFTGSEVDSWKRIGVAAMALGSVAASDLVLAERLAQLDARVSEALSDSDAQMTALSAMMRLEADLLNRMGLTPQARNTIGPLSKPKPKTALDEF